MDFSAISYALSRAAAIASWRPSRSDAAITATPELNEKIVRTLDESGDIGGSEDDVTIAPEDME
jgi:hypothetical protein